MKTIGISRDGNNLYCGGDKPTHVRCYMRFRYGKWEFVCEHCRSRWGSRKQAA